MRLATLGLSIGYFNLTYRPGEPSTLYAVFTAP